MKRPKVSNLTTWALRILVAFIVLVGIGLILLQNLSGTSDSHRKGLEEAFSDFLKAQVSIGQLNEFNIMPQLRFSAQDIKATSKTTLRAYEIKTMRLAFGLSDLMLGNKRIEDFLIEGLKFITGPQLEVEDWRIAEGAEPHMQANGAYRGRSFALSGQLIGLKTARPSYILPEQSRINGKFGALELSGLLVPKADDKHKFQGIEVVLDNKTIFKGYGGFKDKKFLFELECHVPEIKGQAKQDLNVLQEAGLLSISGDCFK